MKNRKIYLVFVSMISTLCVMLALNYFIGITYQHQKTQVLKEEKKNNAMKSKQVKTQEVVREEANENEFVVVLDPGHGGYDAGATSFDEQDNEKDMTLSISKKIGTYIKEMDENIRIVFTREGDQVEWDSNNGKDLAARVSIGNQQQANLFISLHMNSYEDTSIYGFETWLDTNHSASLQASQYIIHALSSLNYSINRGEKSTEDSYLQIIDSSVIPSVLVEMGFITSDMDMAYFKSKDGENNIAKAIANAIVAYKHEA